VDRDPRLLKLPEHLNLLLAGVTVHLVHRLDDACPKPETRILIHGHSHRPIVEWRQNILYLNPGAAGRQGFHTERTAALLDLEGSPTGTLIRLGPKAGVGTPGVPGRKRSKSSHLREKPA
jgi:predicted phosphodiesterase